MAQLEVNIGNPDRPRLMVFHFATIRTQEFSCEPVMDTLTGLHWECNKLTLDIVGVVSEVTIATGKNIPTDIQTKKADRQGLNQVGDTMPLTAYNISQLLQQPRRAITYKVGDVTILDVPRPKGGFLNGFLLRMECDARGGPFVERASFTGISGDKSAILSLRVVAYDATPNQILLSNAWSARSAIDAHGYTTRVIRGRAAFRKDALLEQGLEADDMRKHLLVPTPQGMRRVGIDVQLAANGYEVEYIAVDREVTWGTGENSPIVEVSGSVTSGIAMPARNLKEAVGGLFGFVGNAVNNPFGWPQDLWNKLMPVQSSVGRARAVGRKGTPRNALSAAAILFVLDRFTPLIRGLKLPFFQALPAQVVAAVPAAVITSTHITHGHGTDEAPWAEASLELMGLNNGVAMAALMGNNPQLILKLDEQIDNGNAAGNVIAGIDLQGARLPRGDNTRGTQQVRLIAQALAPPVSQALPAAANLPGTPPNTQADGDVPAVS